MFDTKTDAEKVWVGTTDRQTARVITQVTKPPFQFSRPLKDVVIVIASPEIAVAPVVFFVVSFGVSFGVSFAETVFDNIL